jgi:hypothetical protein
VGQKKSKCVEEVNFSGSEKIAPITLWIKSRDSQAHQTIYSVIVIFVFIFKLCINCAAKKTSVLAT